MTLTVVTTDLWAAAPAVLRAGANLALPAGPLTVTVSGEVDLSAVVVGADGRVSGDGDLVFYNCLTAPGLRLRGRVLSVQPGDLRRGADRVVLVASHVDGSSRVRSVAVEVAAGGLALARYDVAGLTTETVVQVAELYRRGAGWKLRAVGAGYEDGLAGLARDFGVDVTDEPAPANTPRAASGGAPTGVLTEVFVLTNARRAEHGLPALTAEPRLAAAAQAHNDDMVARGFFAHESPEGGSVADRVRAAGYSYRVVAENIAAGQRSPAEVVQGWMDSPGHRRNILNPDVRQIGVGFTEGGSYGTMWTQVFGTPI